MKFVCDTSMSGVDFKIRIGEEIDTEADDCPLSDDDIMRMLQRGMCHFSDPKNQAEWEAEQREQQLAEQEEQAAADEEAAKEQAAAEDAEREANAKAEEEARADAAAKAGAQASEGESIQTDPQKPTEVDLSEYTMKQLVELHNELNPDNPVKKFRNRDTGIERVQALMAAAGDDGESNDA